MTARRTHRRRGLAAVAVATLAGCLVEFPPHAGLTDAGVETSPVDQFAGQVPSAGGSGGSPADGSVVSPHPIPSAPQGGEGGLPTPDKPDNPDGPDDPDNPPPDPDCPAVLCQACNALGEVVDLEIDARCPGTDCAAYEEAQAGTNAAGGPTCHIMSTSMDRTCVGPNQCIPASTESCVQHGVARTTLEGQSACQEIVDCVPGGTPALRAMAPGTLCPGGTCDGAGLCVLAPDLRDACAVSLLGFGESFCPDTPSLPTNVCRFHVLAGADDADPQPDDNDWRLSCGHFCAYHGWSCVGMVENNVDCRLCVYDNVTGIPGSCTVADGCALEVRYAAVGDIIVSVDGMLCDCQLPLPN